MGAGCSSRTKTFPPDGDAGAGRLDPPGGGRLESLDVLAFSWVYGVYIPNTVDYVLCGRVAVSSSPGKVAINSALCVPIEQSLCLRLLVWVSAMAW